MSCTQIASGPRVVSPPISATSYRRASRMNPLEKAASQRTSARGAANASVAHRGAAPIAAISERLTASAL